MVDFRAMTEEEFVAFKAFEVEDYAQDMSRNYGITLHEARASSADQINGSLAQGLSTPNQFLYSIVVSGLPTEQVVGYLWLDVDEQKRRCFICQIYIKEEHRGKGWGKGTLELLDTRMIASGIDRIGLHVFADNLVARELYHKTGYRATGTNMQKRLTESTAS